MNAPNGFIPFDDGIIEGECEVLRTRYIHLRYRFADFEDQNNPYGIYNKGGVTIGYRHTGDEVEWTYALCNMKDNFCRKFGRAAVDGRFEKDNYYVNLWPGSCEQFLDVVVKPKVFEKINKYWTATGETPLEECLW